MMRKWPTGHAMQIGSLFVTLVLLSGCFSDKVTEADMRRAVEDAIIAFPDDVGPGGDLASINAGGDITVQTQVGSLQGRATIQPVLTVTLGSGDDVLLAGRALSMVYQAYCDEDRIIAITQGGTNFGYPDTSAEARNPVGVCTGAGAETILLRYFDFPQLDPSILTGNLRLEEMEEQGIEAVGKKTYAGTYLVEGQDGTTLLTITAKDGRITRIISQNDNAHLKLDMVYADRVTITPPSADHRVPSPVTGNVTRDENGWTWQGTTMEGGPVAEYTLHVYPENTDVGCGTSATPTVSFALGAGAEQSKDGWQLFFFDDGDGTVGDGDEIIIRQPSGAVQEFHHVVAFNDDWAGQTATTTCAIPGPAPLLSIIAVLGFVALRRLPRRF